MRDAAESVEPSKCQVSGDTLGSAEQSSQRVSQSVYGHDDP